MLGAVFALTLNIFTEDILINLKKKKKKRPKHLVQQLGLTSWGLSQAPQERTQTRLFLGGRGTEELRLPHE